MKLKSTRSITISSVITIFAIFFIAGAILPSWAFSPNQKSYMFNLGESMPLGALIFLVIRGGLRKDSYLASKKGWLIAFIGVQLYTFIPTYINIYNTHTAFYAGIIANQIEQNYAQKFNALETERRNLISSIGLDFQSSSLLTTNGINKLKNHISQYHIVLTNKEKLYAEMLASMSDNLKSMLEKRSLNKFTGSEKHFWKEYNIGYKKGEKSFHEFTNIENNEISSLQEIADLFQKNNGMVTYQNNTYIFTNLKAEKKYLALINNILQLSAQKKQLGEKLYAGWADNQKLLQKIAP